MKTINEEGLLHTISKIEKEYIKKENSYDKTQIDEMLENISGITKITTNDFYLFEAKPGIYITTKSTNVHYRAYSRTTYTNVKEKTLIIYSHNSNNSTTLPMADAIVFTENQIRFYCLCLDSNKDYNYYRYISMPTGAYSNSEIATSGMVLTKTNTTAYTPTANYHPATKKYVDDTVANAIGDINTMLATLTTVNEVTE